MGCCLKKQPPRLLVCNKCNTQFPQSQVASYNNHVRQCDYIQVAIQEPQVPQRPLPAPVLPVMPNPLQRVPTLPAVQQQPNNLNPGQAVMDDFNTSGGPKYYWCKELLPNSTVKYTWVKKLIPVLPERTAQGLVQIPWNTVKMLDFSAKKTWFRLNLEKLRVPWQSGSDSMHVSKDSFLMSTLGAIHGINWHKEVKVIIAGEEKVLDAGGLLREWINLTIKEMMHPDSGMFVLADTEDATYKINADADTDEHVLDCFRLLGIVVGKAVFERTPINAFFDRSIIRHILGQSVMVDDMYFYDQQLYQSWNYLLNNDFDPNDLMEYFVIFRRQKGDTFELKPDGSNIMVNNENKDEYVRLCIDYYTYQSVKPFLLAFLNQFYTIVPKKLISVFEPFELEMILYGLPFINLEDWRENTDYKGAYYRGHQTILWFWQTLAELDQTLLAKFLQFCTGSQRAPVEGFRKLESNRGNCARFCIESVPFTRANPYPKAHTCFNRLELPLYQSIDDVRMYLKAIVESEIDGEFGME